MDHTLSLRIDDNSHIAAARRETLQLLPGTLYDEVEQGEISIIVTELVTNILRHASDGKSLDGRAFAGCGELLINPVDHDIAKGIEIIAIDKGNGMLSVSESMQDGYSTGGTQGNGLGAVKRLSAIFDLYSQPNHGTAVFARYVPTTAAGSRMADHPRMTNHSTALNAVEAGGINVPLHSEHVCGDDWECIVSDSSAMLLVVDGLGHGPDAHVAASAAVRAFRKSGESGHQTSPSEQLEDLHFALRSTRGAAASVIWLDTDREIVRFSGVGNVSGALANAQTLKKFANNNGTLGHVMRKHTEFTYPWQRDQLVVLHSDGIDTQWNLANYPGLASHMPSLIAAVLYRDHARGRDDASVVVVRRTN